MSEFLGIFALAAMSDCDKGTGDGSTVPPGSFDDAGRKKLQRSRLLSAIISKKNIPIIVQTECLAANMKRMAGVASMGMAPLATWRIEAELGLPVGQDLNGPQMPTDWTFAPGIQKSL